MATPKPTILHIGDPIKYNPQTHALLAQRFTIVRPSAAERQRPAFVRALRERKWGDFAAILRPFWGTGGEMGRWDEELVGLLPSSVRVFASAGAGFDWADTEAMGRRGEWVSFSSLSFLSGLFSYVRVCMCVCVCFIRLEYEYLVLDTTQREKVGGGGEVLKKNSLSVTEPREYETSRTDHTTKTHHLTGIIYCNGGLAAAEAVADFAVAMVISTFRHLPWVTGAALLPYLTSTSNTSNTSNTSSPSSSSSPSPQQQQHPAAAQAAFTFSHTHTTAHAHNPRGHTLGLIGLGNIGQRLAAKLGNPHMGMRIAYHDIVRKPAVLEAQLGATFHPTLQSLLGASDCVVLCTPAAPASAAAGAGAGALINAQSLGWFKRGARFVNIARGSLVDEDALADALESGRVSAAGLDVHADEPRVSRRLLAFAGVDLAGVGVEQEEEEEGGRLDGDGGAVNPGRVMLTCHNAGGTVETHVGFEELAMRNVLAVLSGEEAITPVNLQFMKARESRL